MNNWYIEIAQCREAQKERLKQVYGNVINRLQYIGFDDGHLHYADIGELITPEQAFERLGLGDTVYGDFDFQSALSTADKKIKELEQKLAAKPLDVDWSKAPEGAVHVAQVGYSLLWVNHLGEYLTYSGWLHNVYNDDIKLIIATRPKLKYTPEQIKAANEMYSDYVKEGNFNNRSFGDWLEEQGLPNKVGE